MAFVLSDLVHEQLIAGHEPPRKRRKYIQADQRIETIVSEAKLTI